MMNSMNFARRQVLGIVGAIVLSASLLAGCGAGQADNKTGETASSPKQEQAQSIKIGYVNIIAAAPAIIAKEKGLIDKQGLKAEFFSFSNGPDLYKALSSGKLDVAYAGVPAAVNWASRGAQFKIIAKVDDGKFGLLTNDASAIKEAADLKGKKLGSLVKGSGVDYLIRGVLLPEAQLNEQSAALVQMDMANMEQAIVNGSVDAAVAGEPFLTFAELRGLKVVKELPDPAFVVLASEKALQQKDVVEKFLQGHKASIEEINKNSKEISETLAKSFNVPEISSNGKTYAPAEVMQKALQRNKFDYNITDADIKFYQSVADTNLKIKLIDQPLDISKVIDRSWVK